MRQLRIQQVQWLTWVLILNVPPSKVCTFRAVLRTFYKISEHIGAQGVNQKSWHRITLQM